MEFTIKQLQKVITELNLQDDDILYNIRMPLKSCEICGGYGIKKWNGNRSELCDCLISTDSERELMPFGVLLKLHELKKEQVYND